MNIKQLIELIVNTPELKNKTQKVLISVEQDEYEINDLWLRGDNTVIIEAKLKQIKEGEKSE